MKKDTEQTRLEEVFATPKYNKDLLVYQENELVRSKKDDLSVFQAKLLRLAIAQITREDNEFLEYKVDLYDLAELFHISTKSAYNFAEKEVIDLLKKVIYIREKNPRKKDKNFIAFQWVSVAGYKDGAIYIKLHEKLRPYLLGLKDYFLAYPIEEIVELDTDNAMKLYELLHSYASQLLNDQEQNYYGIDIEKDEIVLPMTYLREYFNCENLYIGRDRDFIRYVIDPNVEKINLCEPIKVSYRRVHKRVARGVYDQYVIFKYLTFAELAEAKTAKKTKRKKAD